MKLSSKKQKGQVKIELQMTSLIDIVFLLLIFFIVTTSVARSERQLRPAIKVDEESTNASVRDQEPAIVEVVQVGNDYVYRLGANEMNDQDSLIDLLQQFGNKADGAFVRVEDGAPYDMAMGAIQACHSAGFTGVSYVPIND